MKKLFESRKALSPVIAAIILIAVTVAVSIAVASWMGKLTFTFMKVEELKVTNHTWASDISFIDLSVKNSGTGPIVIGEVRVNNELASTVIYISGSATISGGGSATLRVTHNFTSGTKYEFWLVTTTGNKYPYLTTAPLVTLSPAWALIFDGVDDYVQVPEVIPNEGTIDFWFKPSWNGDDGVGHTLFDASLGNKYFFIDKNSNNQLRWWIEDVDDRDMQLSVDGTFFQAGQWYHIAVTWKYSSNGPHEIFVNGGKIASRTYSLAIKPLLHPNPQIGYRTVSYLASANGANGVIDEFKIYSKVLSQEEIGNNMGGEVTTDSLVMWLRFDEGEGNIAYDYSPNDNNGTLGPASPDTDNCPSWVQGKAF